MGPVLLSVAAVAGPPDSPEPEPSASVSSTPEPDEKSRPNLLKGVRFSAFADVYGAVNWRFPAADQSIGRGNDYMTGFALGWAGLDVGYEQGTVGGLIQLRFGPRAARFGGVDSDYGLQYVKQAYATWKPRRAKGWLTFDLGKWESTFGAEMGDSQENMVYSWPFLYWYGQPFFHAGLRTTVKLGEIVSLGLMVVNGWNDTWDTNAGKSYGLQLTVVPGRRFKFLVGYLTGPEQNARVTVTCPPETAWDPATGVCVALPGALGESVDVAQRGVNRRFRGYGDLQVWTQPIDALTFMMNADLGHDQAITNPVTGTYEPVLWWNVAATLRYGFAERWAAAVRGEIFHDVDGYTTRVNDLKLSSGTLVFDFSPEPYLTLRLENRYDWASQAFFRGGPEVTASSPYQVTTTLAAIIRTP
jgi:hypothetical protein